MSGKAITIEGLSKRYRLGLVGSGTLKDDLKGWWYRARGMEDPTLMIGEENLLDKQTGKYVWALRDIDLEVQEGEVMGIIGKNGAGKSTLLKILSRVTGPTSGVIRTRGRIASLLEVGTGMHPELTGKENVFINGAILGMTKHEIKAKFDEIVDFAGIARYIDTPVKRYSSGMHVRLGFAVAAFLEPEILIVDEVLAVGDIEFQKKAILKMKDVSQGMGRSVLFVSHNMSSVRALCQRGIILKNGTITYNGSAKDAVNHYMDEAGNSLVDPSLSSQIDLTKHPNKNDVKNTGLISLGLFCDGRHSVHFYPGCNFKMRIGFKENENVDRIRVGFVLKNDLGHELIGLNNENVGYKLINVPVNHGTIDIDIPYFPLYGRGSYSIDLFLGKAGADHDVILNAGRFYLEKADVYVSGRPPVENVNSIFVKDISFSLNG